MTSNQSAMQFSTVLRNAGIVGAFWAGLLLAESLVPFGPPVPTLGLEVWQIVVATVVVAVAAVGLSAYEQRGTDVE